MALRIHYVINARVPHVRAYGIQIAKMSEALIEAGAELTLVIPRTLASRNDMRAHNGLRTNVRTVVLPGFDWYDKGRILFLIASVVFMIASFLYIRKQKRLGTIDAVYTIDMDTFSYTALPFTGVPVVAEMHGAKRATFLNRIFLSRASRIVATNHEIADSLMQTFSIPFERITIEPNGVDEHDYASMPTRLEARETLGLPPDAHIALYAGRFYDWKGLDILPGAAQGSPRVDWYVIGGGEESFKKYAGVDELPKNLRVAGDKPARDIPTWLAAADTLLILGTKKFEQSYRYTSPMKVYEYMIAQRPVVAANTPALTSIIKDTDAIFYEPDNAEDLSRAVATSLSLDVSAMTERAYRSAQEHTWLKRAERVLSFVSSI